MAYTVTQFREETTAAFERRQSTLRVGCTTMAMIKGNVATFLVAGSGSNEATTRGVNGLIPYQTPDRTQYSATLEESHGTSEETGFDIFQSQGNQARIMQMDAVGQLSRKIDDKIVTQLDTATLTTGAAAKASVAMVNTAIAMLGNNHVPITEVDKMFGAITPGFHAYLKEAPEFANAQYVSVKPYEGPARNMLRWNGVNWIIHSGLTGVGTSSEKCYVWHVDAIGHAANTSDMAVVADYDKKQDASWCRATLFHGAKLMQSDGIVQMLHDGSAFATS